jgi:hypothetical protein
MTLTNPRATFGLNARTTPTKSGTSGTVQIGASNETVSLTNTKQVSFDAIIVGSGSDLVIDISDLDNTGSTAWTAGTLQVETATVTAASGITTSGNATVTVTATGMTGSPKAISVALTTATHTTATLIATAIAAGLNADTAYAALFTATSSGATVITTRKATTTYTLNGTSVPIRPANIVNLNVALAGGLGITAAATSADTTAGVATAGAYVPDLDGNDFEGEASGGLASVDAVYIKNASTSVANALLTQSTVLTDYPLTPGDILQVAGTTGLLPTSDITVEPSATGDESCYVTITLAGA